MNVYFMQEFLNLIILLFSDEFNISIRNDKIL